MPTPEAYKKIEQVLATHRTRRSETEHNYLGRKVKVYPTVFSPFLAPSGYLSLAFAGLPLFPGKRVLDVGCGAGLTACGIALAGAKQVVGIDINPAAVSNAQENAQILGAPNTDFRAGNLFESLHKQEKFDIIFADLPFCDKEPKPGLEQAFYDKHLEVLKRFLHEVHGHLQDETGAGYFCISNLHEETMGRDAQLGHVDYHLFMYVNLGWIKIEMHKITKKAKS